MIHVCVMDKVQFTPTLFIKIGLQASSMMIVQKRNKNILEHEPLTKTFMITQTKITF